MELPMQPDIPTRPDAQYMGAANGKIVEKAPLVAKKRDVIAAIASYLVAFAYAELILMHSPSWGYLAFACLFLLGTELYCMFAGCKRATAESRFFAACLLAVSLARALFSGGTVAGYDVLFLHGLAVYYGLCRTGLLTEGETGALFPCDMVSAGLLLPFSNLFLRCRLFAAAAKQKSALRGEKAQGRVWIVSAAVAAGALLFFAAARILSRADPFFAAAMGSFFSFDIEMGSLPLALLLSLPVGSYLFGLVGGAIRRGKPSFSGERVRAEAKKARVVPDALLCVLLGAFLLLYALFFCFQGSYLFGALRGALPAGFTAAEYARQGFFELCEIVSLNFVLLFAVSKTAKTELSAHPLQKALALTLLLSSLLFAGIAISKMALYVSRFSLTQSRVIASFFMLLLAVWTCLAAIDLLRPFRAVRMGLLLAAALFALLCLINPDARIVEGNLALYQSGRVPTLDVAYLAENCGASEDPVRFYRQLDAAGYFALPRTQAELRTAFGSPAEMTLPDGTVASVWTNARGEAVAAVPAGTAGMTVWQMEQEDAS